MAKSKNDIKYGTSQAKLDEDEALRVAYKHGTPLEGGKIADSETVDLFSSAQNIPNKGTRDDDDDHPQYSTNQTQQHRGEDVTDPSTNTTIKPSRNMSKNTPPVFHRLWMVAKTEIRNEETELIASASISNSSNIGHRQSDWRSVIVSASTVGSEIGIVQIGLEIPSSPCFLDVLPSPMALPLSLSLPPPLTLRYFIFTVHFSSL